MKGGGSPPAQSFGTGASPSSPHHETPYSQARPEVPPGSSSTSSVNAVASSSSIRVNAVASSSSSHTNAAASSSRSYGPPPFEASSSRPISSRADEPFHFDTLLTSTAGRKLAPALANVFHSSEDPKRMEAHRSEEFAQTPMDQAGEGGRRAAYTEADVPGFIEMLSSEDLHIFSYAVRALNSIATDQPALVRDAVLVYMPYVVSLIPTTSTFAASQRDSRAFALLSLLHRISMVCRYCSNELEEHADLEFLVGLLKRSPEVAVWHTVIRLLEGMLSRASEEIRGGNRREGGATRDVANTKAAKEYKEGEKGTGKSRFVWNMTKGRMEEREDNWVDVDDEDEEEDEEESETSEGRELEWELEGNLTDIFCAQLYRFVTLGDDLPENDKGKGKAKAAQRLRWNTADALRATDALAFAITRRMTCFTSTSLEAGALDFLLLVATTPASSHDSNAASVPSLSDTRVAAVRCIGEIYHGLVLGSIMPEDFPYDCNIDADDARFELQGRILMPLLDMIDDPSDARVSDKIVELLFQRFDDLDQSVQIYLWSHGGSVEKLVAKYAMTGSGATAQEKGKGKGRSTLMGPGEPGRGVGSQPWNSGGRKGSSGADFLAKSFGPDHPVDMGGEGKGKERQVGVEEDFPPAKMDTGATNPFLEMLREGGKGKGKEKASMKVDWDHGSTQAQSPLKQKHNLKRNFEDMEESGVDEEESFSHKKLSLPQFPPLPRRLPGRMEERQPFAPVISGDVVHSILHDAGIGVGSQTDLLLERLVDQNHEGVVGAFRAFWERPDVDHETRENLVHALNSPLGSGALKVAAASAGVTVI